MTQDNGASLRDRAFVPSASSQPEAVSPVPASIPSASFLRELSAAFGALEYKHVGWEDAILAGNLADAFESLASAMSAEGQDPQGLGAQPASAVPQGDAQ